MANEKLKKTSNVTTINKLIKEILSERNLYKEITEENVETVQNLIEKNDKTNLSNEEFQHLYKSILIFFIFPLPPPPISDVQ